jgi:hypothetical protein
VLEFESASGLDVLNINTVNVVGFFSDHTSMEEDEFDDFESVAKELKMSENVFFGVVTNATVARHFISLKYIDRTPALIIAGHSTRHSVSINELDADMGIRQWIETRALPLVGQLDERNFLLYENVGLPMLVGTDT